MLRKKGIVRKTFLFVAMLTVLVTLVSFVILYFAMPSFYLHKKEQSLKEGLVKLEETLKTNTNLEACAAVIADFTERYNVAVTAIDRQGMPILPLTSPFVSLQTKQVTDSQIIIYGKSAEDESLSSIITRLYQDTYKAEEQQAGTAYSAVEGTYFLYDIGTVMLFESEIGTEIIDKLQIQGTLQPIDEAREVILSLIPYVLAAGCIIGLCLAWIYARQITKPILKLSETAVRMKKMERNVISGIKTGDELELLSENMDALYQSLSKTIENLKIEMEKVNRLENSKTEMMQSASHELKTPIAALSGMLDGMIDNIGVYKDKEVYLLKCKEQVEKLAFLVEEILEASKADRRGKADQLSEIEVNEMINQILSEYQLVIDEKKLKLKAETDKVVIKTEAGALYRVMMNLIGNAVIYTPPSGKISIVLSKERLVIENQCSYISEEEMQKLFEPFYTRSSSRDKTVSGSGLGLYIVKRNLERLSISYQAEGTEVGFKITLMLKDSELSAAVVK